MSVNKYKLITKFPQKEPTTKNVIDLLYSVFSFKLINEYFINYTILLILDSITKKISDKEIIKYNTVVKTNVETFFFDQLYWSIEESNRKGNRSNLLFQKKVHNLEDLNKIVEKIIVSVHESVNMKSSPKKVEKIRKEIFKKMSLKKIIPFLEKNHLPPLASDDAFKTHKIKEKKGKNKITDENGNDYYLYRENDIISKIPLSYLSTGFQMKRFREENYVSVDLRQFIITKYVKILKKRYKSSKENFKNAVFYLLTYYKLNGFLENTGIINDDIPKIKNKKLEKLYSKSIELIGTPLTVPYNKEYFGLFPDIEQHFGSNGSFYDVNPISGVYSIHLPLSYGFIKNTIKKVNKWLGAVKTGNSLSFLLWVPMNIYLPDNLAYDISTSILANVYKELVPKLKKSKYTKEKYYYLYNKKATENTASHIVFVLEN